MIEDRCIATTHHWGQTVYQNICTGEEMFSMSWGISEYASTVIMAMLIILLAAVVIGLIAEALNGVFDRIRWNIDVRKRNRSMKKQALSKKR